MEASVVVVIGSLAPLKPLVSQRKMNTFDDERSAKGLLGRSAGPRFGSRPMTIEFDKRSREIARTIGFAGRRKNIE